MRITLLAAILTSFFVVMAQTGNRLVATIVDTTGVETEVTGLSSSVDEFGGLPFGSQGLDITIKEFKRPPHGVAATFSRWLYFDEIDQLSVAKGGSLTIRLRSGTTISGSFSFGGPELRGKWTRGEFILPASSVKSLTVKGTVEKPHVAVRGTKATITLRDGTVLSAEDVQRHCVIPSGYINVPASDAHFTTVWIKYKRGVGDVKAELAFDRIRQIVFDKPVVTNDSYSGGTLCKVILQDGSTLSGECRGDKRSEDFNSITGRSAEGPFRIWGDLGYAIQAIKFSD